MHRVTTAAHVLRPRLILALSFHRCITTVWPCSFPRRYGPLALCTLPFEDLHWDQRLGDLCTASCLLPFQSCEFPSKKLPRAPLEEVPHQRMFPWASIRNWPSGDSLITVASGRVDTYGLTSFQAVGWGFTTRKRLSAAPWCRHNSNRLVEFSALPAAVTADRATGWQKSSECLRRESRARRSFQDSS